jgi:hypothetical protein
MKEITAPSGALILAPSAAGKSTYIQTLGRGLNIIDGDDVINDTIGWPKEERWWEVLSPQAKKVFRQKVYVELERYLLANPTAIVLFNDSSDEYKDADFVKGVVIPDIQSHRMYAQRRVAKEIALAGPDAPMPQGPSDMEQLISNRLDLEEYAITNDVPMFTNFTGAIDAIRQGDFTLGVPS